VHRIGRTARAGADGIAISLCGPDDGPLLRAIEKLIGKSIPASGAQPRSSRNAAPNHGRGDAPNPGRSKGRHANHSRSNQRRRHDNNPAPVSTSQEPKRGSTESIGTIAFLRRDPRSWRKGGRPAAEQAFKRITP